MSDKKFAGDKKVGQSILARPEKALVKILLPLVPNRIETYHLTLLTIPWSILNIFFGLLAMFNINWLWMVSVMIILQYVTDLLDGAVGRHRDTGLVKWGFYMDHFLDYIFLCSLIYAGYLISPEGLGFYYIILLTLTGGFMVNSFLSFAATNTFQIYFFGFGPTEIRIVFILINTLIIYTGTGHFVFTVPLVCLGSLAGLIFVVWQTHKKFWEIDMENKKASEETM